MSTKKYHIHHLEDWHPVSKKLLVQAGTLRVWCLRGGLGSGKTTLVKALCQHLGTQQPVTSPTFTLIHQYDINVTQQVYHLDFYRVKELQRLIDIGFESLLYTQDYVFIEWPQIATPLLPPHYFDVCISLQTPTHRMIQATAHHTSSPKNTPHGPLKL